MRRAGISQQIIWTEKAMKKKKTSEPGLLRRIVADPERPDNTLKAGIYYTWPYGWEPADFTPMMRRILGGKRTRHVMMFDEFHQGFRK